MVLNPKSRVPLHKQAEDMLRKLIDKQEYRDGKLLPNEVELAKSLNISRNTLRQAINQLVFEGLLERKKGVGTKVTHKGITGGVMNWLSFSQEMKTLGIEVKNYELLICNRKPSPEIANFFECSQDADCVVMERIRGNAEHPFVKFISYFNPALPINGDENYTLPLYEMMEQKYGIVVKTSKEELSARLAGEQLAHMLQIKAGDPILIRKRFVYDENDVPVEYNIGYYRADSFTYSLVATR
ncbi:MAG: GntR family transcriptional regulator [Bacteroidales bacterium]|nr:GntR family transcriptional regulator [Bacteroidales bacterium]